MSLGKGPSAPAATPPPPPPPNLGTAASSFGSSIASVRQAAAAGEGKGFDNTITNTGGAQGIASDIVGGMNGLSGAGSDAKKILTGQ